VPTDRRKYALWVAVVFAFIVAAVVNQLGWTDPVLLVLFAVGALATNLYVAVYWFRPWRATPQGEALMIGKWGNAILLNLGLAALVFGPNYPGRDYLRVLGLTAFTVGICYLLGSLLTATGARDFPPFRWRRRG
jgi:hypothetical protein